jgi:hypothetical protein
MAWHPPEEVLLQHRHGGDDSGWPSLGQGMELGTVSLSKHTLAIDSDSSRVRRRTDLEVGRNEIGDESVKVSWR